jgi:molybdopterin synthase sulfur carrier subunit
VKVNFYATLREIVGQKTVDFDIPSGSTIGFLIQHMVGQFPNLRAALVDADGQLRGHVHVFVNGRDVPYLESQMDTVLKAEDAVSVFPAVGGGA